MEDKALKQAKSRAENKSVSSSPAINEKIEDADDRAIMTSRLDFENKG